MNKHLVVVCIDNEPVPPLLKDLKYISAQDSPEDAVVGISIALSRVEK